MNSYPRNPNQLIGGVEKIGSFTTPDHDKGDSVLKYEEEKSIVTPVKPLNCLLGYKVIKHNI